ncbi:MAG TPA: formate dehydrogenase accessory protein FdhE [Candidatus Acidoferrales bacterium]|jgi:FdhE protein|nr:formate dehydrogenase accessory protein FdhE [Candidatus Acidoferrales bacterium]
MTGSAWDKSGSRWDKRIARAAELEHSWPPAAELLRLYLQIAEFQAGNTGHQARATESILRLVANQAPPPLSQAAEALLCIPARWQSAVESPSTPAEAFFSLAVRQPRQEALARRGTATRTEVQPLCPFCGSKPVVAILRPEGDGAKRSLLCSLCFTEWDFRRLLCPQCGEEDKDKLPVYIAAEFPHIRVEACDTCRSYIKSVDLTRNGLAVPEVDELASISLDLWAAENGYSKLQTNLFGL